MILLALMHFLHLFSTLYDFWFSDHLCLQSCKCWIRQRPTVHLNVFFMISNGTVSEFFCVHNPIAMASNLEWMACNLIALASNLEAMPPTY